MKISLLFSSTLVFLLPFCCFFSPLISLAAQESPLFNGTIPAFVQAPGHGEALRYPQDTVIGSFGIKELPSALESEVYTILDTLLNADPDAPALSPLKERENDTNDTVDDLCATIRSLGARTVRIGEGREEPDGCFSFVFRFISPDHFVTGELYCIMVEEQWRVDDLVLDGIQEIVPEDPIAFNKRTLR
ncbi:MAG: hypothetical protein LBO67_09420 [Spirochaetaceae bacterium]|jgi:hypothetical protein|nr:hypothetical protein [Spirochaetaceae bacterium]